MLIEVKEEDYQKYLEIKSKHARPFCCPIANSLKRTFGVEFSWVNYSTIKVGQFPDNIIFEIPIIPIISVWLEEFDSDPKRFSPISFELELPSDLPIS